MNWLIFWIVIYLIVIVILALRHIKTGDFDQYLVNNRNTRTLPLVFTILATFVGGGTSIGLMALGYESGFAAGRHSRACSTSRGRRAAEAGGPATLNWMDSPSLVFTLGEPAVHAARLPRLDHR